MTSSDNSKRPRLVAIQGEGQKAPERHPATRFDRHTLPDGLAEVRRVVMEYDLVPRSYLLEMYRKGELDHVAIDHPRRPLASAQSEEQRPDDARPCGAAEEQRDGSDLRVAASGRRRVGVIVAAVLTVVAVVALGAQFWRSSQGGLPATPAPSSSVPPTLPPTGASVIEPRAMPILAPREPAQDSRAAAPSSELPPALRSPSLARPERPARPQRRKDF